MKSVRIEKIGLDSDGYLCSYTWHSASMRLGNPLTRRVSAYKNKIAIAVYNNSGNLLIEPFKEYQSREHLERGFGRCLDETTVTVVRKNWQVMAIQVIETHDLDKRGDPQ